MKITWYGQTCFQLQDQDSVSIVTDPYPPQAGLSLPKLNADIVTVSYNDSSHLHAQAIRGPFKFLDGPGEYEISNVFITGIPTFADGRKGAERGLNTVFTFDFNGLTVCHLGRLGHVPTQSQIKDLGAVNVLLVPVGGGGSLTPAQASKVISLFEPSIAIPMYYQTTGMPEGSLGSVDHFLKEVGKESINGEKTLTVSATDLSEETQVIVLEPVQ